jgi:hypothetical protein
MIDRFFRSYILPEDNDVVFVGLDYWVEMGENPTPLLGTYLCDSAEVNARFDALEADLKRCRREALAKIERLNRKTAASRRPRGLEQPRTRKAD